MFRRLAVFSERRAAWIVAAWMLAALVLTVTAPSLQDVGTQDDADFLPKDAPSQRADRLMARLFPDDPTRDAAILVFAREGGLTDADRTAMARVAERLVGPEFTADVKSLQTAATAPELAAFLRSPDGEAELMVVGFRAPPFTSRTNAAVARVREAIAAEMPEGVAHHATGVAPLAADQADALVTSFDRTALVTVVLVVVILLLVYRSVVAALVPLFTISVAFLVARGAIALMAEQGFKVASLAETFMVVMVFGAGVDYCLFIVSRYKQELGAGDAVGPTLRRVMAVVGAVIAASALTVIVGFLSQMSAKFGLYRTMGPAMGVAIAITLLAGILLTPALLRLLGGRAFWPQRLENVRATGDRHSRRWSTLATAVRERPAEMLLAGVIALLVMSAGLGWYQQSFDLVKDLPAEADARKGYETLAAHYPGGRLSPIFLVLDGDAPITGDGELAAIDALTDQLRAEPGIGEVRSVTQPAGAPLTLDNVAQFGASGDVNALGVDPNQVDVSPLFNRMAAPEGLRFDGALLRQYPQIAERLGYFLGSDGSSARLVVSLDGNPFGAGAMDVFRRLDDVASQTLAGTALSGATIAVGGPSSFYVDMQEIGNDDFRTITAVLIAGIFVVLALLLRSLVAPLYLLATVLFSFVATMGLAAGLFVGILDEPGLSFYLPPFLFVILVALGADYNIFIMSRIREEAEAGYSVDEAAARGLVLTGPVITSAGLILAGTFGALVLAPLPNLRQIGFAVTAGVLIDTFVVRSFLVPSITVLLGRWAFWPTMFGAGVRRSSSPRVAVVTGGLMALLAAGLVALVVVGEPEPPTYTVSAGPRAEANASAPQPEPAAGSTAPAVLGAAPPTTAAGVVAERPVQAGPATTAAGAATDTSATDATRPAPTSPSGAPPDRVAVPTAGDWAYHVEGTRRFGAAGTDQPFAEDTTTRVARSGGSEEAPEVTLSSESGQGSQEERRRYGPTAVELLSTKLGGAGASFSGTFDPPQVLLRWPVQVGQSWSSPWSTGSTSGTTTTKVTGTRDVDVAGARHRCWVVRSDTTFSGEASGEQHRTACWVERLGMSVDTEEQFAGTYNGVPFDVRSRAVLRSHP